MSGGSYDYLYIKEAGAFIDNAVDWSVVEHMGDTLARCGYVDAAMETHQLQQEANVVRARFEARLQRLRSIWKAVEWMESGDSGRGPLDDAIADYRGEKVAA